MIGDILYSLTLVLDSFGMIIVADGTFYYVAPNTGRQGMSELKSALSAVGIDCVSETAAPSE